MKKKKEVFLNSVIGFLSQFIILALGLVVPRLFLKHYGSDVNGLTNTVTQIFMYVALLEAGISQAARNALYKPLHENNTEEASDVLHSAKKYYTKVTIFYALIVLVLSSVLPFLIKTNVGYWTVFGIVIFEGASNILSFYFIQTWSTLMIADGKNYVRLIIELVGKVLGYGIKIVLALYSVNIVILQSLFFVVSIIKVVFYYLYIKKHYKWISKSNKEVPLKLKDKNYYLITEIAYTVFSSTDMIVLSIFVSSSLSSVYSIYAMIFTSLNALLNSVYTGVHYILGAKYHTSIEEYKRVHNLFNSIFLGAMTIFMSVAYMLTIPFVTLYTDGVTDINYIYKWLPLLFCLIQMLSWSRNIAGHLTGLAGYAKYVSRISIAEAACNIISSVVLVHFFGIVGVLLATVVSLPLKVIYVNYIADKVVMKNNTVNTLIIFACNYLFFIAVVIFGLFYEIDAPNYWSLILFGCVLIVIFGLLVFILNILCNKDLLNFIIKRLFKKNETNN